METVKTSLVSQSVQSFCAEHNIASIGLSVRTNTNGYGYLTFINASNESENIYFSKSCEVAEGEMVDKEFISRFDIGHTTNADGELRTKLIRKGGGNRVNVADLF